MSDKKQADLKKTIDGLSDMSYKSDAMSEKPNGKQKRGFNRVTFRPSQAVREQLRRLNKAQHARASWAINQALLKALPAVLERIGV